MAFTLKQRAIPGKGVLFQQVGAEAVLLDMGSENYFGLNPVGARIWQLLGVDGSLQATFDVLCREYDASPDRLRADLLALVAELADARLVQVD